MRLNHNRDRIFSGKRTRKCLFYLFCPSLSRQLRGTKLRAKVEKQEFEESLLNLGESSFRSSARLTKRRRLLVNQIISTSPFLLASSFTCCFNPNPLSSRYCLDHHHPVKLFSHLNPHTKLETVLTMPQISITNITCLSHFRTFSFSYHVQASLSEGYFTQRLNLLPRSH